MSATNTTTTINNNNYNYPLSTISRSTSPILQQLNHNNEQTCNLTTGSSCFNNISSKLTNERFTSFVHAKWVVYFSLLLFCFFGKYSVLHIDWICDVF